MHSPNAWKTPASLVVLALLGVLIAVYGRENRLPSGHAAFVGEPARHQTRQQRDLRAAAAG